jgi:hypothetical protein
MAMLTMPEASIGGSLGRIVVVSEKGFSGTT